MTMLNNTLRTLFLLLLVGGIVMADEVTLKGGKKVYGTIIKETRRSLTIMTIRGKRRLRMSDVETVIENAMCGDKDVDAKIEEIDGEDPDALAEVAAWAKKKGSKAWKVVAWKVKSMDADNDEANALLGWHKAGESWYRSEKEAKKARRSQMAREMKEKGYILVKKNGQEGWVKKDERKLVQRNADDWMVDEDGIWKLKSEVMKARGYVRLGEKWVKASPKDLEDMERFRKLMGGDEVIAVSSAHFRLFVQGHEPDKVVEFSEFLEETYVWFLEEMGKPKDHILFRGNKANIWVLSDWDTTVEWFKHWRGTYGLGNTFETLLNKSQGNVRTSARLFSVHTLRKGQDVRHSLAHDVGHFGLFWFSPGLKNGPPAWLSEAFGHLAEHVKLGQGSVNCSTLAQYGGDGGIAKKEFGTSDVQDRAKGLVREGSDEPFVNLNRIKLNQLNGDHLTKGFGLVQWFLKEHHDQFVAWLEAMNKAKPVDALKKAFQGWTPEKVDNEWRKYVKDNF